MMNDRWRSPARACGFAAPAVLLSTAVGGALAATGYEWPRQAFSEIATTGEPVGTLFSAGLVVTGLVALPFALVLAESFGRVVGAGYGLVAVGAVGAGAFPMPHDLHAVFGTVVVAGPWLVPWAAAVVDWRAGRRRKAALGLALGAATPVAWLPYDLDIQSLQAGMGGAELIGFVAFALWSGWVATRLRAGRNRDAGRRDLKTAA